MANHRRATVLTGGGTGALDKIDGAGLSAGDVCQVVNSTGIYHYVNIQDSESENSPYVIRPDTNPGTNSWHLVIPQGPMTHIKATTTAGQSGITTATDVKLLFATEIYDYLSEFTGSKFTATKDGLYKVKGSILIIGSSWVAGDRVIFSVFKNGSFEATLSHYRITASTSASLFLGGSITLELSSADYLELYINHDGTGDASIGPAAGFSHFTIDRII